MDGDFGGFFDLFLHGDFFNSMAATIAYGPSPSGSAPCWRCLPATLFGLRGQAIEIVDPALHALDGVGFLRRRGQLDASQDELRRAIFIGVKESLALGMLEAFETVLDQAIDQGHGGFLAKLFLLYFFDQVQDILLAPHAFIEPDFIVERARIRRLAQNSFLLATEAAKPQLKLFHGLFIAQLLALFLVAAQVLLAVVLIIGLE